MSETEILFGRFYSLLNLCCVPQYTVRKVLYRINQNTVTGGILRLYTNHISNFKLKCDCSICASNGCICMT